VTLLIIALAAAPALAVAVFIYWKDKYDPEPKKTTVYKFCVRHGILLAGRTFYNMF